MDARKHILVVDDEEDIRDPIAVYLEAHDLRVSLAGNASEALGIVGRDAPDLAVLDIMLERSDGYSLCRDIQKISDVPVIFLSGKGEETERIIGLELGADDYIAKPFNPRELLARIRAVLRRYEANGAERDRAAPAAEPRIGPWRLDAVNQELVDDRGQKLSLSTGETRLLEVFLNHPNTVMSRDELLEKTRGRQSNPFDRSIDNYISRLRKKIEPDPANPTFIKTYWGGGYSLNCMDSSRKNASP